MLICAAETQADEGARSSTHGSRIYQGLSVLDELPTTACHATKPAAVHATAATEATDAKCYQWSVC